MLDLDHLQALADAATKSPWLQHGYNVEALDSTPREPSRMDALRSDREKTRPPMLYVANCDHFEDFQQSQSNATFIAAARSAVPELVAEVRRLRTLCEDCYMEGYEDAVPIDPRSNSQAAWLLSESYKDLQDG